MSFTDFHGRGATKLLARNLPPVVFMAQLYSSMAFSLYVSVWIRYHHDPFGTRLFETLVEI
jgi:hypothetical protein